MKNIKILNLILRYLKETGKYAEFKTKFKNYVINNGYKYDLKNVIEQHCYNSPLLMLRNINLDGEISEYDSNAQKYIYLNLYKKQIQTLFENFLKKENLYENFIESIDENFISRNIRQTMKNYPNDRLKTLYENVLPMGFIMNAFLWNDTKEKTITWANINSKWEKIIDDFFNGI